MSNEHKKKQRRDYKGDLKALTVEYSHLVEKVTKLERWHLVMAVALVVISIVQSFLFFAQNKLFTEQNDSINSQTELLSSQNNLIKNQNTFISTQTELFKNQNSQFEKQNQLIELQTKQIDSQIGLLRDQNDLNMQEFKLMEAQRRSSLILLMSNVMDKLYEEIEVQRDSFEKQEIQPFQMKFAVSPALRARIIGLSRALKPYHILENGIPSEKRLSPERGQILVTLLSSQLDNSSLSIMFSRGDFSYADLNFTNVNNTMAIENASLNLAMLQNAVLRNLYVYYTDCHEIQLNGATLEDLSFQNCDLSRSNFSNTAPFVEFYDCNLEEANFTNCDLANTKFMNSSLCYADFKNVKNLKLEHFKEVKSLYGVKNLPKEIERKLDKSLFDKAECKEWIR